MQTTESHVSVLVGLYHFRLPKGRNLRYIFNIPAPEKKKFPSTQGMRTHKKRGKMQTFFLSAYFPVADRKPKATPHSIQFERKLRSFNPTRELYQFRQVNIWLGSELWQPQNSSHMSGSSQGWCKASWHPRHHIKGLRPWTSAVPATAFTALPSAPWIGKEKWSTRGSVVKKRVWTTVSYQH